MKRLRMAVIGVGHLGKEHARILAGLPDVELVGVADVSHEQAQAVARRHNTQAFSEYWPLFNLVDAASIVVPTTYHLAVAREFLKHGIPLLVEKPLARTVAEARELSISRFKTTRSCRSDTLNASTRPTKNYAVGRFSRSSSALSA